MENAHPVHPLAADLEHAAQLALEADAESTRRAYRSDVADFVAFARARGVDPRQVDALLVVAYVADLDRRALSITTIRRRVAALSRLAASVGAPRPTDHVEVRTTLRGLARRHASAGRRPRRKKALTGSIVRHTIRAPDVPLRDKALLGIGFATGMRRSELAGLDVADVEVNTRGLLIHVRRSKTDRGGEGAVVAVPYAEDVELCPARLLQRWLASIKADEKRLTSVFGVSASTVNRIVKAAAKRAGHDPSEYGAHSLRAGLCTAASQAGVALAETMAASRHRDANVAASYFRGADAMSNQANAAAVRSIAS